jgi:hypothetical protein
MKITRFSVYRKQLPLADPYRPGGMRARLSLF